MDSPASHLGHRTVLVLLGLLVAATVELAPCANAQQPTLASITLDGELDDWAAVLQNPAQVIIDGDSSTLACDASGDLDCPVQSTGRDLRRIAWTHDDERLFFLVTRQGNDRNTEVTWIYFDVTGPDGLPDDLMGDGDLVWRIRHGGRTGEIDSALFGYVPAGEPADEMVDVEGRGDGHALPGGVAEPALSEWSSALGGAADGLSFEAAIPWSELAPVGTPVAFHVSSSNDPEPSRLAEQVDDDAGGPDGGRGRLGIADHAIGPDSETTVVPGGVARHAMNLVNHGPWPARFELAVVGTLGLPTTLLHDDDGDGVADALLAHDSNADGDFEDDGDVLVWDRDGDGHPEPGPDDGLLAVGATTPLVVEVRTSAAADGLTDLARVGAWGADATRDSTRLAREATAATHVGLISIAAEPRLARVVSGRSADHRLRTCNAAVPDRASLVVTGLDGWDVELWSDDDCNGTPERFLAVDRRSDGRWDVIVGGDGDGDGVPDTGLLPSGDCACHVARVTAPARTRPGDREDIRVVASGRDGGGRDVASFADVVAERLEIFPDHRLADGTGLAVAPGRSAWFPHVARNNASEHDRFDFAALPPWNEQGHAVRVWSDPDGDGRIADGEPVTLSDLVAPNGGEWSFVVEVRLPPDAADGTVSRTTTTGTSSLVRDERASAVDEAEVSGLATYRDAALEVPATVFEPCATIHAQATGLMRPGGPSSAYDLEWFDGAGRHVRHRADLAPDALGRADDAHGVADPDVAGDWLVELRQDGFVAVDRPLVVEGEGAIDALSATPERPRLVSGGLTLATDLRSLAEIVTWRQTRLDHVVLDPSGTQLLRSGASSRFEPWDGVALTRSVPVPDLGPLATFADAFVVPDVVHPQPGAYSVEATWLTECGMVLGRARSEYLVLAGEDCANGADDDGDGAIDCADADCAGSPDCHETDCGNGVDDDGDGAVDCDDADCAASPECPETACGNSTDDDGDGLVDCEDPDCLGPDTDCDGDGVLDPADCAPSDPRFQTAPPPAQALLVTKLAPGIFATSELRWLPGAGSESSEILGGALAELHADRGVVRATCLGFGLLDARLEDSRRPADSAATGFYYLARARNPCGVSELDSLGATSQGRPRLVDSDPCLAP